ncbi:tetratricopeptide repeat protein [Mesonia aquimarina]|uniref:tetratricopeptide repeat protein n=1 Tax=Mesonia aquimarina TaxID=1504967 RepID=UPI000EF5CA39|nr:tetratricopeptide repeat protein [Mesonia aquimarina]
MILTSRSTVKFLYLFLFFLPFCIYFNAIDNEYAIDDNIVVDGVEKVDEGLSGISKIFTTHYSTDDRQNYGYRPITQVTFALEKEFFNNLPANQTIVEKTRNNKLTQANISHFINILLYAITVVILFYFLQLITIQKNLLLAFLISLFFLLLPIHTEPVNNIKSRDELLVFIFIIISLIFFVKYSLKRNFLFVFPALIFVFLAVLSKKSGIALLGLVPVVLFYIKGSTKQIIVAFLSILIMLFGVLFLKNNLINENAIRQMEYFENPLFFEGDLFDRIATAFYCAFFYLKMMIFPQELSFYYGFSKIPIVNWSHLEVWFGIIIFFPLSLFGLWKLMKRDILGLGIAIWLGTMIGVLNIFEPVVGVVADRFAYIFSLGFCIVVSVLLIRIFKVEYTKSNIVLNSPKLLIVIIILISLPYVFKTIDRNKDWENYLVLYRNDIKHLENSAKANVMLANEVSVLIENTNNSYHKRKLIDEALKSYKTALKIDPKYGAALNNLASIHIKYFNDYNSALPLLLRAEENNRDVTFLNIALTYYNLGDYEKAVPYFTKAIERNPDNEILYDNLFHMYDTSNLKSQILYNIELINSDMKNKSYDFNINIGKFLYRIGEYNMALVYYENALKIDPKNKKLTLFIDQLNYFILNNT